MSLDAIRAHVAAWGGLNAADATQLLDLLEHTARGEHAIQAYNEDMTPDHDAERMIFVPDGEGDWVRMVTPWRAT